MKIVSIAEAKARLSRYVRATRDGPVVLTRNGSPVAVVPPVEDPDELERLILAYSPRFKALLAAARRDFERSGGIDREDFWDRAATAAES